MCSPNKKHLFYSYGDDPLRQTHLVDVDRKHKLVQVEQVDLQPRRKKNIDNDDHEQKQNRTNRTNTNTSQRKGSRQHPRTLKNKCASAALCIRPRKTIGQKVRDISALRATASNAGQSISSKKCGMFSVQPLTKRVNYIYKNCS